MMFFISKVSYLRANRLALAAPACHGSRRFVFQPYDDAEKAQPTWTTTAREYQGRREMSNTERAFSPLTLAYVETAAQAAFLRPNPGEKHELQARPRRT